jgi:hypothetical protein
MAKSFSNKWFLVFTCFLLVAALYQNCSDMKSFRVADSASYASESSEFSVVSDSGAILAFANTARVLLKINATATAYCVNETEQVPTASLCDPSTGSTWSNSPPGAFDLSQADGEKTLYLWLMKTEGAVITTPLVARVTLDRTQPTGLISQIPDYTNLNSLNAAFQASDQLSGVASTECKIDLANYANCTFPLAISNLQSGTHSLSVRVSDKAGNQTTFDKVYVVDRGNPVTTVTRGPNQPTNQTSATFEFTSVDAENNFDRAECKLDAANYVACTSPTTFSNLQAGSHVFNVRGIDRAGNVSNVAAYTWTVDLTAPQLTLTANVPVRTRLRDASFTFSSTNASIFECSADGVAFATCTSPRALTALADGPHTMSVRATTATGNSTVANFTWLIDNSSPVLTLVSSPSNPSGSSSASFVFSATDVGSGVASYECRLDSAAYASCASPHTLVGIPEGAHTVLVRALDQLGNVSNVVSFNWQVILPIPPFQHLQFPNSLINVALRKSVTSLVPDVPPYSQPKANINDGSYASYAYPGDFQFEYDIHLDNRYPVKGVRLVFESFGSSQYVTSWTATGFGAGQTPVVLGSGATPGRYVDIFVNSNIYKVRVRAVSTLNWIGIQEAEVWALDQPGLNILGYYGVPTVAQLPMIRMHANMVQTDSADFSIIQAAGQMGLKSFVSNVYFTYLHGSCTALRSDRSQWIAYANLLEPLLSSVGAIYLADEPYGNLESGAYMCSRQQIFQRLQEATTLIKQRFSAVAPNLKIAIVEDARIVNADVLIPPNIDWVGFDCYPGLHGGTFESCAPPYNRPLSEYVNVLKNKLQPNQRIIIVPESFFYTTDAINAVPSLADQSRIADLNRKYIDLALSEPQVIGVWGFVGLHQEYFIPFTVTAPAPARRDIFYGVFEMPNVLSLYDRFGRTMKSNLAFP